MEFSIGCEIASIITKKRDDAPFSPTQISDLRLWLDAADASSITLNGSNVSQWADKSGNNNHFSQATAAKQPAYVDQLGGNNVITFDGADDWLSNSSLVLNNPTHIYLAVKEDSDPGETLATFFSSGLPRWELAYDGRSAFERYFFSSGSAIVLHDETPANLNFNLYILVVEPSFMSITRNDSLLNTSTENGSTSSVPWGIGSHESGVTDFLDGKMAEILAYGKALSSSEKTKLRNYFNTKWGI